MAPLSPENHMMTIIFLVIWWDRNLLQSIDRGKMLKARPSRMRTRDQTTENSERELLDRSRLAMLFFDLTETQLHSVREGENSQAEIDKYRGLADEGERPHGLLHRDLGDRGEVVVGVVRHDEAAEQDGHDAGQVDDIEGSTRGPRRPKN